MANQVKLDPACTSTWHPGLVKKCKIRDFLNCSHPDWPLSCPVVSEAPKSGCRVFFCPTDTKEEFYSESGGEPFKFSQTTSTTPAPDRESNQLFSWFAFSVSWTVLFVVGLFVWHCCLTPRFRQIVREWVGTLRDGAIAISRTFWRSFVGCFARHRVRDQGLPLPVVQAGPVGHVAPLQGFQAQGGVLGHVAQHLHGPGVVVAPAVPAQVPNPPQLPNLARNRLFNPPNLPPLPQVLQVQQQQLPRQGRPRAPPPPVPPAPVQAQAQAGESQLCNFDDPLGDLNEQFNFFTPNAFYYQLYFSDSDSEYQN